MLNIKTYVEYHHLEIEDKFGRLYIYETVIHPSFYLIRPDPKWNG